METRIILGADIEIGIELDKRIEMRKGRVDYASFRDKYIGEVLHEDLSFFNNGGLIYEDCAHPEICIPECASVRDSVRYEKAMEKLLLDYFGDRNKPLFYKNVRDSGKRSNSFGAHDNYFVPISEDKQDPFILFTIIEKLWTGAGHLSQKGKFRIAQSAQDIDRINRFASRDENGRGERGLIEKVEENLGEFKNYERIQCSNNDPNMCEYALFLKRGARRLVYLLHQHELLPKINYKKRYAIKDIKDIIKQTDSWRLKGTEREWKDPIKIARAYNDSARKNLKGLDSEVDFCIDLWDDALKRLERAGNDLNSLYGRLDWATLFTNLKKFKERECLPYTHPLVQSNAYDYSRLDEEGIFAQMEELGLVEKLLERREITEAMKNPPKTRALLRHNVITELTRRINPDWKIEFSTWDRISLVYGSSDKTISMPDPWEYSHECLQKIITDLESTHILR
ncbi:MAG: proteasome accessory factor PafA2 family protein [Nanoarchaeota archaeon]